MKKLVLCVLIALNIISVANATNQAQKGKIQPITREMGSGTRSAFVELFDLYKKEAAKKDAIASKAEVTNSTGVMLTSIAKSKNAIGYISLGSLNNSVKALKVDGIAPSTENIKNKSYSIVRPFIVVVKKPNALIDDFLNFASSTQAKSVIEKAGFIAQDSKNFTSKKPSGKLVIAGSSSVSP